MTILVVHCHPSADSYTASLKESVIKGLKTSKHTILVRDLYADRFSPVLTEVEWRGYLDGISECEIISMYREELKHAQGLVMIYPTWWYGMPALLKGWLDRVWAPGLAFEIEAGRATRGCLKSIERFAVVTTYGAPKWWIKLYMGDPGRKAVLRGLRPNFSKNCRAAWYAAYGMDRADPQYLSNFRRMVFRKMQRF